MTQHLGHSVQSQILSATSCCQIPSLGIGVEWWSGGVVEWWSGGVVERWSGGVRCRRRMGVATARPSASVLQSLWRTVVLAVGRFGGVGAGVLESTTRQTHPTYGPGAVLQFVDDNGESAGAARRFVSPLRGSTVLVSRVGRPTVGWHPRLRLCQPSGL